MRNCLPGLQRQRRTLGDAYVIVPFKNTNKIIAVVIFGMYRLAISDCGLWVVTEVVDRHYERTTLSAPSG